MTANKKAYVYLITNVVNGKIYIGKTIVPEKRWQQHCYAAKSSKKDSCSYLNAAIRKYGTHNFTYAILSCHLNEDDAFYFEKVFIDTYATTHHTKGYNLNSGGLGGYTLVASTCKLMSIARMGRQVTIETRTKLSNALIGNSNSLGCKRSPETIALRKVVFNTEEFKMNQRKTALGRKHTDESKLKIGKTSTGRKHSEKTKTLLGLRSLGNSYALGYKHTDEAKASMSDKRRGRIQSEETKKKRSVALIAAWQRRKIKRTA